jgi:hypothetical protein
MNVNEIEKESQLSQADRWLNNVIDPSSNDTQEDKQEEEESTKEED